MQRNEKTWLHAVFESSIDAQGALQKLTEYGFDSNEVRFHWKGYILQTFTYGAMSH